MATTEIDDSQIRPGSAYQLLGTNSGATAITNLTLSGTTSEINVGTAGTTITLSTPQAIATTSTPTFASETLTATTNQLTLGTTHTTTISSTAPSASRTITVPDAGASSNMVLDQGNYTIDGTWTFSNAITITPTTNQLVLGTTRTTTISATQPATSSRTVTIPDPGANDTFTLLGLAQTISGAKTFSAGTGAITMSSSTIAMGSNKITGLANGTTSTDATAFGQILGFRILQIVPTTSTATTVSTTSTSYVSTNFSVTITPTLSTSKILLLVSANGNINSGFCFFSIERGSTDLSPSTGQAFIIQNSNSSSGFPFAIHYLDSPATTSSTTYTLIMRSNSVSNTTSFNFSNQACTFIACEIG